MAVKIGSVKKVTYDTVTQQLRVELVDANGYRETTVHTLVNHVDPAKVMNQIASNFVIDNLRSLYLTALTSQLPVEYTLTEGNSTVSIAFPG